MDQNETTEYLLERPEHKHYAKVEDFILMSIEAKDDLFFDKVSFDKALCRLEEEYEFPYEVGESIKTQRVAVFAKTVDFSLIVI